MLCVHNVFRPMAKVEWCRVSRVRDYDTMGNNDVSCCENMNYTVVFCRGKLMHSEAVIETMKRSAQVRTPSRMSNSPMMSQSLTVPLTTGGSSLDFDVGVPEDSLSDVIALAKNEIELEKRKAQRRRNTSQR